MMDGQVAHLDSLAKDNPKAMQGYRIQIYFGSLSEARAVKAAFRKRKTSLTRLDLAADSVLRNSLQGR